jgi:putative two-component system response regulator
MTVNNSSVLVIDDDKTIADLICRWLKAEGYDCSYALEGVSAVGQLKEKEFDVVVCDIMLPGMSGMDLLMMIKKLYPDLAVIMETGIDDMETAKNCLQIGAYGYITKPFKRSDVLISVEGALERKREEVDRRKHERALTDKIRSITEKLDEKDQMLVLKLLSALAARDDETEAHSRRLGMYAATIAQGMGWDQVTVSIIRNAAPLHDIGKVGIRDGILLKPGSLTSEEFEEMKLHTVIGSKILGDSELPVMKMASEIAEGHHERWDGSGYPHGLAGMDIPAPARIVGVVDVYDALVHDRVYRPAMSEERALDIMVQANQAGQYDPDVFYTFLRLLPDLRSIKEQVPDESLHPMNIGDQALAQA